MNFEHSGVTDQRTTNSSKTSWMIDNAGLIVIAFGLCSAGLYAGVFRDLPFTEDPGQWGAFGSYVGGLLSPLVSIFTLVVAIKVWNTQKEELAATRIALEHSSDLMAEQLHSMEATRYSQMLDSCLADLRNAMAMVHFHCAGDAIRTDDDAVTTVSKQLEKSQPLVGMNSRTVTWVLTQQPPECKPELEPWDWSIAHGNEAREYLRMMLPMCRSIGQALQVVALMPAASQPFHFARVRNALSEWMLSTFTYFLVLHPDGQSLQGASALGNVLRHLKIQRAHCFAQTYLPSHIWNDSPC